ncbi:MAG: hypothetical protein HZA01_00150 [Nitrospinae bacterium]|nr:hypothetical protein [Nitrospinota bacterium]
MEAKGHKKNCGIHPAMLFDERRREMKKKFVAGILMAVVFLACGEKSPLEKLRSDLEGKYFTSKKDELTIHFMPKFMPAKDIYDGMQQYDMHTSLSFGLSAGPVSANAKVDPVLSMFIDSCKGKIPDKPGPMDWMLPESEREKKRNAPKNSDHPDQCMSVAYAIMLRNAASGNQVIDFVDSPEWKREKLKSALSDNRCKTASIARKFLIFLKQNEEINFKKYGVFTDDVEEITSLPESTKGARRGKVYYYNTSIVLSNNKKEFIATMSPDENGKKAGLIGTWTVTEKSHPNEEDPKTFGGTAVTSGLFY